MQPVTVATHRCTCPSDVQRCFTLARCLQLLLLHTSWASLSAAEAAVPNEPWRRWPICNDSTRTRRKSEGHRFSVEEATCALGCSKTEPVLVEHLRPWYDKESPLSVASISKFCSRRYGTLAVVAAINNGSVYWRKCHDDGDSDLCMNPKGDFHTFAWLGMVQEIVEVIQLPDLFFMMQCSDQPAMFKDEYPPLPVFHSCGGKHVWNIPWLNPFHLKELHDGILDTFPSQVPWADKIGKVYWRGQLSMPDETPISQAGAIPRIRMFELAKQAPELFDIGVTGIDDEMDEQWGNGVPRKIAKRHGVQFVTEEPLREYGKKYKYVLNVIGVLSSWRLVSLLMSGSVLLLQESKDWEALHVYLTPWKHFVPIKSDLSDLLDSVRYLEDNQEHAQKIAEAGLDLFGEIGTPESLYCFTMRSLLSLTGPKANASLRSIEKLGLKKAPDVLDRLRKFQQKFKWPSLRQRVEAVTSHSAQLRNDREL